MPRSAKARVRGCARSTTGLQGNSRVAAHLAQVGYDPSQMSRRVTDERLHAAIEAMADGAIVADTRSGAVVINRAARVMLGIPEDAEVDTTYLKDTVGFYPFDLAVGAPEGEPIREEVRIGDRVLHSVVTPLMDGGEPSGGIVVLRDLGDTAHMARRRAEFAQVMSHELRTPLTSIAGALDIVLSGYAGTLSDRQLRYIDMARQAATRMNQLVDQLLDLARAQDRKSTRLNSSHLGISYAVF